MKLTEENVKSCTMIEAARNIAYSRRYKLYIPSEWYATEKLSHAEPRAKFFVDGEEFRILSAEVFYVSQTSGVGCDACTDEERVVLPVLDGSEFERLLQKEKPGGNYAIGSASGAITDGLIKSEKKLSGSIRVVAEHHIGHGCYAPVAVLAR